LQVPAADDEVVLARRLEPRLEVVRWRTTRHRERKMMMMS
jgi:hypothetical protein